MPDVSFVRQELRDALPRYDLIRDCIEQLVKERRTAYLPMPNADDTSVENKERYNAYLLRAVFYNVTARTLGGLVGEVFRRDPVINLPSRLDAINKDANGSGINLTQSAKEAVSLVVSYGRAGLFVDYPTRTDEAGNPKPATVAELDAGDVRPTINLYHGRNIINWRTKRRGAKHVLSLVVLSEKWTNTSDMFSSTEEQQYRVLRLDENDVYRVEVWREGPPPGPVAGASSALPLGPDSSASFVGPLANNNDARDKYQVHERFTPTDGNGATLKEIPFTFIGPVNNDSAVDTSPLYDMAIINVAHFRNSADYEESCFVVGQPTVWVSGLTNEWYEKVLNKKLNFGSRGGIPLPVGGEAGLLQVEANTMPKEAMEHKERQMVALGAKLVEQQQVQRTATEANIENTSEVSTLSSSANNVSLAFKFALEWCAAFLGIAVTKDDKAEDAIKFELNTDFEISKLNATERAEVIASWQSNAIAFSEMRAVLRKAGIAILDDEAAREEIDNELKTSLAFAENPGSETQDEIRQQQQQQKQQQQQQQGQRPPPK